MSMWSEIVEDVMTRKRPQRVKHTVGFDLEVLFEHWLGDRIRQYPGTDRRLDRTNSLNRHFCRGSILERFEKQIRQRRQSRSADRKQSRLYLFPKNFASLPPLD